MENKKIGIVMLIVMLIVLVMFGWLMYSLLKREICYNLPFNDFYQSDFCEVYR